MYRLGVVTWLLIAAFLGSGFAAATSAPAIGLDPDAEGLSAFASESALRRFLDQRQRATTRLDQSYASDSEVDDLVVTGAAAEPSITNNQEVGVDEGGIVKVRGDILVVLRRGRLFTISTANGGLAAVDSIAASPPGVNGSDDWYDEMLVVDDQVIVIGFSYERGGTEINRFRLDRDGGLTFQDAYHLRSNDYYSASNYASRLIGDALVLYSPMRLDGTDDPMDALPGARRWKGDAEAPFRRIARAGRIYVAPGARPSDPALDTLHTVTRCRLTAPTLDCSATAVLGPSSRTFYVSGRAVYLWTASDSPGSNIPAAASVYRMPLDGGRPQAARARGAPLDQFSFREDARRNVLNVVVTSESGGDAMWGSTTREGSTSLLTLPLSRFGTGRLAARKGDYRVLSGVPVDSWNRRNRFVGDYLLYAANLFDNEADLDTGHLVVTDVRGGDGHTLVFPDPVSRIEAIGRDALVVTDGEAGVTLNTVRLEQGAVQLEDRRVLPSTGEAESRSHGFFYRADPGKSDAGVLGLPVRQNSADTSGSPVENAVDMVFIRLAMRRLAPLGILQSRPGDVVDDHCVASCMDWYGDARPIFLGERIFALLGYELVEGRQVGDHIDDISRLNFSPVAAGPDPDGAAP